MLILALDDIEIDVVAIEVCLSTTDDEGTFENVCIHCCNASSSPKAHAFFPPLPLRTRTTRRTAHEWQWCTAKTSRETSWHHVRRLDAKSQLSELRASPKPKP